MRLERAADLLLGLEERRQESRCGTRDYLKKAGCRVWTPCLWGSSNWSSGMLWVGDRVLRRIAARLLWSHAEKVSCTEPVVPGTVRIIRATAQSSVRRKIVVLKFDHFGDLVIALPAMQRLRSVFAHDDITLICGSWNRAFAAGLN